MMTVKKLNKHGISIFLQHIESNCDKKLPDHFLSDPKFTNSIEDHVELDETIAFAYSAKTDQPLR